VDRFGVRRRHRLMRETRPARASLTSPGVNGWHGGKKREMARRVNEYKAELVREWPDRFGCFATLPLPDVQGSLA
jgi:6-methylsalicylate decarboxylase